MPVLFGMSLRRVIGMFRCMKGMGPCRMGMVCGFLVVSRLVVLCRLSVMPGCVPIAPRKSQHRDGRAMLL